MAAFKQFLVEFDFNANFADDIRHAHMHEFFQSLRELVNKGGVMTTDINKMMRYVAEAILHPEFDYEKFDWEQMPEKVRPIFLCHSKLLMMLFYIPIPLFFSLYPFNIAFIFFGLNDFEDDIT